MASSTNVNSTNMQSFTATGRPYSPPAKSGTAMDALSATESWGAGPTNLLPMKFTDESLISVPVLRPEDVGQQHRSFVHAQPDSSATEVGRGPKFAFFRHHKSTSPSRKPGDSFTMRRISRREYLAHYAKDDSGKYIGTEDPADDCILRGEDLVKYRSRGAVEIWKNEVSEVRAPEQGESKEPGTAAAPQDKRGKRLFRGFRSSKDCDEAVIH